MYWDCQYSSFETATAEAIFWQAIVAAAIPARTMSLTRRETRENATLARNSSSTYISLMSAIGTSGHDLVHCKCPLSGG